MAMIHSKKLKRCTEERNRREAERISKYSRSSTNDACESYEEMMKVKAYHGDRDALRNLKRLGYSKDDLHREGLPTN